ncbi:50S ribosomal protein L29 [Candidatus Similichlamydia epinepheli]|uniref:50S ribosomal protein L29 n=1 Tax=Candidatus Similichlamydia epinepheli TaxID=1903953 RepID=UPI000D35DDDF|nr:50S ribosomal protein L29 [Candidatus Similichlamydia epinepheli]
MSSREDLSKLSEAELRGRLDSSRCDLFFLSGEYRLMKKVSHPHRLKLLRKTIARLLTEKSKRLKKEAKNG